jgi:diketogulonate reductase-like aldo/keto reductase
MQKLTREDIKPYTLGTWLFGGDMKRNPDNDDQADINAIKMHIENGVNQIFTAQNYAEGWTEKLVGKAIKDYNREDLVVMSAIRKEYSAYDDAMEAIEKSLKRIGVDYLDIVVHHAPHPDVPRKETIKAMNKMVDDGLARGIAVSNYSSESVKEATANTTHPILFNQVYYNLFVREVEEEGLLETCLENDIYVQAYRPLELGELASVDSGILEKMSEKYSLTKAQVALTWLTSQEDVILTCATHKEEHLRENLKGIKVKLENDDIELLREEFQAKELDRNYIR